MPWCRAVLLTGLATILMACSRGTVETSFGPAPTVAPVVTTVVSPLTPTIPPAPSEPAPTTTISPFARPEWLGTRVLPLRSDGYGEVHSTPPELVDRRLLTIDLLPPPAGVEFEWSISTVPDDVLARSSWSPDCPVAVDELAYLTVSHLGFDGLAHTGELLVNASVADDVVAVFGQLHEAGFPIEQMRVIQAEEIGAPPTGDGNETTSFVCRPAVGSNRWSQHAFGLAIDINPFHNPYVKGDLVLPELASAYTDRSDLRPGMIVSGDAVAEEFARIGWGWGGDWSTLKDWMHFSLTGR